MIATSATWTAQNLTLALHGKWNGRTGKARCPAHDDHTPSLSITTGTTQEIVVHCFVCDQQSIVARLKDMGLWPMTDRPFVPPVLHLDDAADDEPNWPAVTPMSRHTITYDYYDANGVLLFQKLRYEPKTFRIKDAHGRWGLNGVQPVLYRLPEIVRAAPDTPIYMVEGEKDADALRSLGFVATTNFDGAEGMWLASYSDAVAGRHVVIIPDNDAPGEKHAQTFKDHAMRTAASVRLVRLTGLPEKGDVSDWLAAGGTVEQLQLMATEMAADEPRFSFLTVADIEEMPSPEFLADGWLVQEGLSVVYGPSGVGKSFAMLDLGCSVASGTEWLGSIPVVQGDVLYVLAEGVGGVKERLRAWKARNRGADLSRLRFLTIPVNLLESDQVQALHAAIRAQLPSPTLVIFDTLARAMSGGDENSAKDMGNLVAAADSVKAAFHCHVSLVHHTGKNGDSERGSSALRAACDTSIYISSENGLVMECMKQKDSVAPEKIGLKLAPVAGTESCVLEPLDMTGEVTATAMRLLRILGESFPLDEGASTSAWLKASGLPERTFYRARTILVRNQCVVKEGKIAPNMVTTLGCRDLDITPSASTPGVPAITAKVLPWQ